MTMTNIRISGFAFSFPSRYTSGEVLGEAEAHALNQLRAENISNNVSGWVKEALRASGGDLGEAQLEDLSRRIADYARAYQFRGPPAARQGSAASAMDELYEEARAIAGGEDPSPEALALARARRVARRELAIEAAQQLGLGL